MTYRVFNPTIPACNPPTNPPTVIQQYDIGPTIYGCPVNNAGPNEGVDLDLADDKGFASMWAPTVVPKVVFWKFNPTTGKPQLLYSADGASWTGVDFGTVAPAYGQAGGGVEAFFVKAVVNAQSPPQYLNIPDE